MREPPAFYGAHAAPGQSSARILVVDGRLQSRFVLVERLKALGVAPLAIDDGVAALQAIALRAPALILTNCHMPGMDGYEIARRIRHWEAEQGMLRIPIIALCATANAAQWQKCMDSGMDGLLKKPSRARELQAVLQLWVEQLRPPVQVEPFLPPPVTRQAYRYPFAEDIRTFEQAMEIQDRVQTARLRVMLLDDHEIMRRGLELLLKQEYSLEVVGSFRASRELFAALKEVSADVIVSDYALGSTDVDGLRLIRALKRRYPRTRILVMSSHHHSGTAASAIRAGAHGFIGKSQDPSDLLLAIRTIAAGRTYLCRELAQTTGSPVSFGPGAGDESLGHSKLSPQEREVLRCLLDGMSVTAIAAKFSRAVTTISAQKHAAFRKLGIRSNSELFKTRYLRDEPSASGRP
ncbi:response regulator [Dyella choica]|uniref:response regulator n=1 Tax=Dyella choica TaxID=1927959 RepID=UPI0013152BDF|nr:response regulator [Dyella choica]